MSLSSTTFGGDSDSEDDMSIASTTTNSESSTSDSSGDESDQASIASNTANSDGAMSEGSDAEVEHYDFPGELHDETPARDRFVYIFIKDHADTGTGMKFKIKYRNFFLAAFSHFEDKCCKNCKPVSDLRFRIGTKVVSPYETPEGLELLHNTTTQIKVFSTISGLMCRRCEREGFPTSKKVIQNPRSLSVPRPISEFKAIKLMIEDQTGFKMPLTMPSTSRMEMLMEAYAKRALRDMGSLRFLFEGERLNGKETPKKLEMESGDNIQVCVEQFGG